MGLTCVRAREREEGVTGALAAVRWPVGEGSGVGMVVTTLPRPGAAVPVVAVRWPGFLPEGAPGSRGREPSLSCPARGPAHGLPSGNNAHQRQPTRATGPGANGIHADDTRDRARTGNNEQSRS